LAITKLRKDDSLDRIEAYISSLTDSIKSSFKSYDTGNSYINSLLAVKDNEATEKGIRLEVDFNAKLDLLQISDQVLISIISNIIDNAFDAMDNITHSNHKFHMVVKVVKTFFCRYIRWILNPPFLNNNSI
jgi:sensor histidine kinase regulating citrate/malate metabolism